jgi:arylsulfatase
MHCSPLRSSRLLALVCALAPLTATPAAEPARRPNVLIVLTDDQGLGDFSFMGNPVLKTPNLDSFAKQSVRFTDFHVAPMCSPTRGQLMTGLAALRNGATSVTAGRTFLRPGLVTLPQLFGKAGYRTGIFGKWHLGDSYPHRPIDRGFQESVYHLGWGQLMSTPEFDMPLIDGRYFHNGREGRYKGHCTDFWFDSAMAWMKKCKDAGAPFFCYLPTNAPHAPCIDLEEYVKPYRKPGLPAGFFGMIRHIDRRFGDLEKFLSAEGLQDDTIVVFMTDNGGTGGVRIFNAGMRGGKTTYYEGGHRVPCWIRWPGGKLGEPRDVSVPAQNTDLMPTLCALCGIEAPKGDELFRGTSLAGLLRGTQKALPERTFVVQYGQIIKKHECCVVRGKWRLVKGEELYDVEADRAQKTNLAERYPDVVKALRGSYETWWKALEPIINDFVPISIGAAQQPVVELTSGDWEGIYADNTGHVREAVGGPTGGHWHILVERPGRYELTLRRWPAQTKAALGERYEPRGPASGGKAKVKTRAFPTIAVAKVEIAGVKAEAIADPKATGATLAVTLPAGKTTLQAWFADAGGKGLCGAFFVTVARKE